MTVPLARGSLIRAVGGALLVICVILALFTQDVWIPEEQESMLVAEGRDQVSVSKQGADEIIAPKWIHPPKWLQSAVPKHSQTLKIERRAKTIAHDVMEGQAPLSKAAEKPVAKDSGKPSQTPSGREHGEAWLRDQGIKYPPMTQDAAAKATKDALAAARVASEAEKQASQVIRSASKSEVGGVRVYPTAAREAHEISDILDDTEVEEQKAEAEDAQREQVEAQIQADQQSIRLREAQGAIPQPGFVDDEIYLVQAASASSDAESRSNADEELDELLKDAQTSQMELEETIGAAKRADKGATKTKNTSQSKSLSSKAKKDSTKSSTQNCQACDESCRKGWS
jgi:hypothetical protein